MKPLPRRATQALFLGLGLLLGLAPASGSAKDLSLLNVSYDATREFYQEIDATFAKEWQAKTGDTLTVNQSHGGSGKQARAVIDGLEADVVTLALANDIDKIAQSGLLPANWQQRLPDNSSPYTSTIVFVVRAGNPKKIHDWNDLIQPGVTSLTPNPKTGGASRWTFLAAWGYALQTYGSDDKARDFVTSLYKTVPVLDSGMRGSITNFAQNGIGDVLLTWENEAHQVVDQFGNDKFQIIIPSVSILTEPSVAWVDKNTAKHGTDAVAQEYLRFLYTPEAQDIIGKYYYRPRDPAAQKKYAGQFAPVGLFTIDKVFGGWAKAQARFFDDGAIFDQIYQPTGAPK